MGLHLRCFIFALILGVGSALHGEIAIGTTRAALIAELGKPNSIATRGSREILSFPHGVRMVLRGGVVSEMEGYPPDPSLLEAPVVAANVSAQSLTAPSPTPTSRPTASSGDSLANLFGKWPPPLPDWRVLASLAIELVGQYLLTLIVIRIMIQVQHIEALWSGINAIAGIDLFLQTIFTVGIVWLTGNLRYGVLGAAIPGLVMLWSVRRYCFDEHRNRSGTISFVAKICAVGLYVVFLFTSTRVSF